MPDCKCIFVSGTAAIKGQQSISLTSIEEQTELTIQNIQSLLSVENLQKQGIKSNSSAILYQLRVYVKIPTDIQKAKAVCLKYFPLLSIIYLVADICRPELLVEIEGQATLD
jgi:enamine deaminase RidA (YjgF/YER057c/UK114 family)